MAIRDNISRRDIVNRRYFFKDGEYLNGMTGMSGVGDSNGAKTVTVTLLNKKINIQCTGSLHMFAKIDGNINLSGYDRLVFETEPNAWFLPQVAKTSNMAYNQFYDKWTFEPANQGYRGDAYGGFRVLNGAWDTTAILQYVAIGNLKMINGGLGDYYGIKINPNGHKIDMNITAIYLENESTAPSDMDTSTYYHFVPSTEYYSIDLGFEPKYIAWHETGTYGSYDKEQFWIKGKGITNTGVNFGQLTGTNYGICEINGSIVKIRNYTQDLNKDNIIIAVADNAVKPSKITSTYGSNAPSQNGILTIDTGLPSIKDFFIINQNSGQGLYKQDETVSDLGNSQITIQNINDGIISLAGNNLTTTKNFVWTATSKDSTSPFFPNNILLNRELGLNKRVTGDLSFYKFSGGNNYSLSGFGGNNSIPYSDLRFISINTAQGDPSSIYFKNKIDLTPYSKLKIKNVNADYGGSFAVGIDSTLNTRRVQLIRNVTTSNIVEQEMDISDLSGEYYIGFVPSSMAGTGYTTYLHCQISEITLE